MAETSRRWSPYTYAYNNPLRFIDPDGMENQDSQEGFYYSNGYQTLNSKETTGSVTFEGAYMNAGGEGGGGGSQSSGETTSVSSRDDRPKPKNSKVSNTFSWGSLALLGSVGSLNGTATLAGEEIEALILAMGEAAPPALALVLTGYTTNELLRRASEKTYVTYIKYHKSDGSVYVGRCSGVGNPEDVLRKYDATHRKKKDGYGAAVLDRFTIGNSNFSFIDTRLAYAVSAYSAIRGREQQLYDYFKRTGVPLGNAINPIWEYNPLKPMYMATAEILFGPK